MISPTTTDAALLIPPPMALPAPSALLTLLQVLTFFGHLVLVNILLGSVMLAILDRRAAIPDEKNGVAFMPKTLALAVNFAIAPFLFLQVLYGNYLYTSIILMAVWWLALVPAVMLAYYGLYLSDSEIPVSRRTVLIPTALLLLAAAFLLTSASTLMQRPDQWLHWFSAPHGMLLNLGDATLFPRYLHIVLASLAAGGLTMAWRADRSLRHPETDVDEALWRRRRGLAWFFHTSLAQIAAGLLFLFTQPASIRALFLGGEFSPYRGADPGGGLPDPGAVHGPPRMPRTHQRRRSRRHSGDGLYPFHDPGRHVATVSQATGFCFPCGTGHAARSEYSAGHVPDLRGLEHSGADVADPRCASCLAAHRSAPSKPPGRRGS